jgi:hypothetical protein
MAYTREWQAAYEAAVFEIDDSELIQKVNDAEAAIFRRLQTLDRNPANREESRALENAINGLQGLRRRPISNEK